MNDPNGWEERMSVKARARRAAVEVVRTPEFQAYAEFGRQLQELQNRPGTSPQELDEIVRGVRALANAPKETGGA